MAGDGGGVRGRHASLLAALDAQNVAGKTRIHGDGAHARRAAAQGRGVQTANAGSVTVCQGFGWLRGGGCRLKSVDIAVKTTAV